MTSSTIYLDHNATTPIHADVRAVMLEAIDAGWGNPSSGHAYGRQAHEVIERARAQVAALIGASPDEIVFTSGGTEASNLAIGGTAARRSGALVISSIEHPATREPCRALAATHETRTVGVDADGRVDTDAVARALRGAALVSIMHSNNETGVLQPIAEIAPHARAAGARLHSDAAQSVGKVRVDVRELDVDLLTIAGHKLYGPKGVGALYARRGVDLEPQLRGAPHERGLRPGTENVVGIAGLGAACALAASDLEREARRVSVLRDRLVELLRAAVPGLVVHGERVARLPSTASVRFPRVSGPALLRATPGVAASTGAACHSGSDEPSAVIRAMGVSEVEAIGTVRLSLGRGTTQGDVERAAALLAESWARLSAA